LGSARHVEKIQSGMSRTCWVVEVCPVYLFG